MTNQALSDYKSIHEIGFSGSVLSCVRLLESMVPRDLKENLMDVEREPYLLALFNQADKEYLRVKDCGEEFYLSVFNPSFIVLPSDEMIRIMKSLGSSSSHSGEWSPAIVKCGSLYYRIWGNANLCG
ncbi:MAG: hypothetical protein M1587_02120 [Thaumarchaeota archaeon]|nr:hypothetical protein [Nitrososphaerota archaeon]